MVSSHPNAFSPNTLPGPWEVLQKANAEGFSLGGSLGVTSSSEVRQRDTLAFPVLLDGV